MKYSNNVQCVHVVQYSVLACALRVFIKILENCPIMLA